jgi:hypothetical protein
MVRMKGQALRIMQEQDRDEYLEELSEELDQLLDEEDPVKNCEAIAILIDEMEGIESGRWLAPVPAYDPRDERATKVGHENPIEWIREQEKKMKELKRLRRIGG